jgi:glycosyltransferase involved in cell wall biosynthesis
MLERITPVILTLDESANIARTLEALAWARDVVIVDSLSGDDTRAIAQRFPNVRIFERRFDTHEAQWNFALSRTAIATEWVLALDADYVVPAALRNELEALRPGDDVDGFRARFVYCVDGRPLRSAVYPPVTVLYRRDKAHYVQDGHTQRIHVEGTVRDLEHPLHHDDRKPLERWFRSQGRYMRLEAEKLGAARFAELPLQDRVRKLIVIAPFAMLLYCLFIRGNVLDGRAGVFYAMQRSVAEAILSLYLAQALLR